MPHDPSETVPTDPATRVQRLEESLDELKSAVYRSGFDSAGHARRHGKESHLRGPNVLGDHGALEGLADDDHPQYLKERASGGLASEVPLHAQNHGFSGADPLSVTVHYVWSPDAAPGADVTAGVHQGPTLQSGPNAETAEALYAHFETAAGTSVSVQVQYGDTGSLSTVTTWTTIFNLTVSGKSASTTGSVSLPADRVLRMNVTAINGSAPKDGTVILRARRPLRVA